jgi:hypothetical protein
VPQPWTSRFAVDTLDDGLPLGVQPHIGDAELDRNMI